MRTVAPPIEPDTTKFSAERAADNDYRFSDDGDCRASFLFLMQQLRLPRRDLSEEVARAV